MNFSAVKGLMPDSIALGYNPIYKKVPLSKPLRLMPFRVGSGLFVADLDSSIYRS